MSAAVMVDRFIDRIQSGEANLCDAREFRAYVCDLEAGCIRLSKDNHQLRRDLAVRLPPLALTAEEHSSTSSISNDGGFQWRLECRPYRVWFGDFDRTKVDTLRRIRRQTLRDLLREVRVQFEKTWSDNGWPT